MTSAEVTAEYTDRSRSYGRGDRAVSPNDAPTPVVPVETAEPAVESVPIIVDGSDSAFL